MTGMARRLAAAARWPAASTSAGIHARVRWLDVLREGEGVEVPLRLLGGTTGTDVERRAEALRALYRCARVEVVADRLRGDWATVVLHRSVFPDVCDYPALGPAERVVPLAAVSPLPLGVDTRGRPVGLPLFTSAGGSSVLVGGVPGSGKTGTLRTLLAGLAPTTASIVIIDPTGGAEAALWRERTSASVLSAEAEPTVELLSELLALIERRGRVLGAGATTGMLPPVVLVCDELAELAAAGTTRQQEDARTLLRRVVALGRKANVSCVLATQRTTATSIDVTTRSLAAWRIALAHPGDVHGSEAILGAGRREAAELSKGDVGVAYVTSGGVPSLVRVYRVDEEQALCASRRGVWRSMSELAELDEALLRELRS